MAKQTWVNAGGTWKPLKTVWINTGGTWKKDIIPMLNVSGTYKECMSYSSGRLYATYNSSNDYYRELNPDTLAVINGVKHTTSYVNGIGGIKGRLFSSVSLMSSNVYELNPNTLTVISTYSSAGNSVDIGGTSDRLFSDDGEKNTTTLATISAPIQYSGNGIGGISNRLYVADSGTGHREVNLSNLAIIYNYDSGYNLYGCIGGTSNRLYARVRLTDSTSTTKIEELNPSTLVPISQYTIPDAYKGIGGIK